MRLDRNIHRGGKGKYILINARKLAGNPSTPKEVAAAILLNPESVEFGCVGDRDEFFPIKLKDKYAGRALQAYADAARVEDPEYAHEVQELAMRAGTANPYCKRPD